jgi:hypothetical protein
MEVSTIPLFLGVLIEPDGTKETTAGDAATTAGAEKVDDYKFDDLEPKKKTDEEGVDSTADPDATILVLEGEAPLVDNREADDQEDSAREAAARKAAADAAGAEAATAAEEAEEEFAQKKAAEEELAAKKPAIEVGAAEKEADADAEEADAKEATDDEGPSVGIDGSWHHYF